MNAVPPPLDPNDPCLCGSGIPYSLCCRPILPALRQIMDAEADEDFTLALRLTQEALARHETNRLLRQMECHFLIELERFDECLISLEKVIELAPDDPLWRGMRGDVHVARGDFAAAVAAYREALDRLDPSRVQDRSATALEMAICCGQLGDYPAMLTRLTESLELDPSNEEAHEMMQLFLIANDTPAEARLDAARYYGQRFPGRLREGLLQHDDESS